VPGIGFDADPAAAAILPLPGKLTGSGTSLSVDPAENNAFRAINRAWKQGAGVQFLAGAANRGGSLSDHRTLGVGTERLGQLARLDRRTHLCERHAAEEASYRSVSNRGARASTGLDPLAMLEPHGSTDRYEASSSGVPLAGGCVGRSRASELTKSFCADSESPVIRIASATICSAGKELHGPRPAAPGSV